jgi:L-2-hydroxyglutarate oxidase
VEPRIDFDIVVIGGGIVGLASAYKIALGHPEIRLAVLEKEEKVAVHQTGHNSGVIHSGLYYEPGSNKAKTCSNGRKQLVAFAKKHQIPHEICGKIIVATDERELPDLEDVWHNGLANEVEGIEKIGPEQIKKIEPNCTGIAGIHVPCTGIIDFVEVANKLAELIGKKEDGNNVFVSHEVVGFDKHDFYTRIITSQGDFKARYIINCAGLQSDRIARMDGVDAKVKIIPFRGDYYQLTEEVSQKVNHLIYPVPDPTFPFLGIHFTRMIDGSVECGPNAVFSFKREGYGKTDFSWTDAWESLTYWGTWKLFIRHWKYGLSEYARAYSKKLFLLRLRRLIPSLGPDDIIAGTSGVRAQAIGARGKIIDDFKIERKGNSIHVLNAPSPAATAAFAIGDHICKMSEEYFKL